jgi:hypothetical protein
MDLNMIDKCYRGLIGIDSPFGQVLEKQLFGHYGSEWTEKLLKATIVSESENKESAFVNLQSVDQNCNQAFYSAKVSVTGYLPTLQCMSNEFSNESSPQYSIDWQADS